MSAQIFLIFSRSADPDALESCNLITDHFFFGADMVVLLLTDETYSVTVLAKSQIRIVLSEKKSVLSAGGHHSVRFSVIFGHEVVDQNADVSFRSLKYKGLFAEDLHSGIDSGHQSLRGSFLISAAAVELTGTEESVHISGLKSKF